jgi:hypothetical protein
MKRLLLLAALTLLPATALAKSGSDAQDANSFTYLGRPFAIDKSCTDGEAFIVGKTETLLGTSVSVLYAFPMPGSSNPTLIGPKDRAATGPLQNVSVADGLCLTLTTPTS